MHFYVVAYATYRNASGPEVARKEVDNFSCLSSLFMWLLESIHSGGYGEVAYGARLV